MSTSVNRFKWARENLTTVNIQTVAKTLGIPRSLIDEIESDNPQKRGVSYLTVKKLADFYGVSMDWICSEDLPLEEWSIKKDARIAAEYTGLSSAAVESLGKINAEQNNPSSESVDRYVTRKKLESYNFFLSNAEASEILTQVYLYLYADFGMFFRQPVNDSNSIHALSRESFRIAHDLFFSSDIQFLLQSDQTDDEILYSFGFSANDYANLALERITDAIKKLRKELQDLNRQKIREIIKSAEKQKGHGLIDDAVPE